MFDGPDLDRVLRSRRTLPRNFSQIPPARCLSEDYPPSDPESISHKSARRPFYRAVFYKESIWNNRLFQRSTPRFADDRGGEHLAPHGICRFMFGVTCMDTNCSSRRSNRDRVAEGPISRQTDLQSFARTRDPQIVRNPAEQFIRRASTHCLVHRLVSGRQKKCQCQC
jgi:hypothetical protein